MVGLKTKHWGHGSHVSVTFTFYKMGRRDDDNNDKDKDVSHWNWNDRKRTRNAMGFVWQGLGHVGSQRSLENDQTWQQLFAKITSLQKSILSCQRSHPLVGKQEIGQVGGLSTSATSVV
jgi:hypothetical protein